MNASNRLASLIFGGAALLVIVAGFAPYAFARIYNPSSASSLSGTVPIAKGGTATTTQVTNGVNFYDGTQISSSNVLSFNAATVISSGARGVLTAGAIISSPPSTANITGGSSGNALTLFTSVNAAGALAGLDFGYNNNGSATRIAQIQGQVQSGGGGDLLFNTAATGGASYLTKMLLSRAGLLGIATSTPNAMLTIAGTSGGTTNLLEISTSSAAFATSTILKMDSSGVLFLGQSAANGANVVVGSATASGIFQNTGGPLYIQSQGLNSVGELAMNQYLYLRQVNGTNGNAVGIGFDLSSSIYSPSSQASGVIEYLRQGSSGYGDFLFFTRPSGGAPTERLRITSDGFVGIGTSTPRVNFQVSTSTANATSSMEVGKAGQNKGSCITLYNNVGTAVYLSVTGTTLNIVSASCN